MTRNEAKAFIDAFVKLRDLVTDEQAIAVPALYPAWKVNIEYAAGQRILYNNILYKVIQAHTSQESWTPEAATSLFAKVLIPDENTIPEWEQPSSTNPYMRGDKVTYDGKIYECQFDYNVYSPVDYPLGWTLIE